MLASLRALGKDLRAPIATPAVAELAEVSGGIARLANELAEAQLALAERERLAVLGRVTAGVAHEVRNPLAAIKLRIDMARRSGDASHELASDLHDIGEEVDRLDRLVTDLLTIAGRKTGPRTEQGLGALVRRRVALLEPLIAKHGVSISVGGDAVAAVEADAFARAVDNLVRNAIEASPPAGEVRVEIVTAPGVATIRVLDPGLGVDKPREAELFEPFFTTKPDGVGLGLALTKAIAESHGGRLSYRRDAAETVFELTIPQKEGA
jgi:signal transduction histidine kinase